MTYTDAVIEAEVTTGEQMITLDELAARLGVHRSNARKIALDLDLVPVRRQRKELGHNQRMLCWTPDQVSQIVAERRRQGFKVP